MTDILIILFLGVVLVIGIFCVTVVTRDIVAEGRERRSRQQQAQQPQQPQPIIIQQQPYIPTAPVVPAEPPVKEVKDEAVKEVPVVAEEQPAVEQISVDEAVEEGNVAFSAASETLEEKYLSLDVERKGYYDEIVRCAMAVEGSKRYKNAAYEEYKVGTNRIVRLKIKRGTVVCEFIIANLKFKSYVSDNKVAVKQAPAVIKVTDEASLSAAKDSIQIAINAIEEEKAYKKEQAKLRRQQRRQEAEANK